MLRFAITGISAACLLVGCADQTVSTPNETKEIFAAVQADPVLNFSNRADFDAAERGFIATLEGDITDANGKPVYSPHAYDFLKADAPNTVNPSLWRQSQLNAKHGLFEVVDGIYQVRGFDLSNMTLIRGDKGWIIVDPLITKETAAAALALANKHLGTRPVVAVILTHSHIDHYGGIRGIASPEDIASGKVENFKSFGLFLSVSEPELAAKFDRVLVFEDGVLVEQGPPDELKQKNGRFARLLEKA